MSHGRQRGRRLSFRDMRITRGALYLLFIEVGLSLVYLVSSRDAQATLASWLVASADTVWREYKLWTLVTTSIFEIEFISLLFHALLLWMFLPTLERWWGTRKFLLFALWTSLAGNTAATLVGLALGSVPIAGLDPFIFGSIVAFGILYGKQQVQFFGVLPMTGKQMMIGILAFVALFVVIGAQWVVGAGYAAAMALAWLLVSGSWRKPRRWLSRWRRKRARRHLEVIDSGHTGRRDRDMWVN